MELEKKSSSFVQWSCSKNLSVVTACVSFLFFSSLQHSGLFMTELKAARQLELVATSHPVKYSDLLSPLIIGVEANYVVLLVNVQLWPLVRRNSDFVGSTSVIFELLCYSSEVFVQPGCRAAAERESAGREADRGKNNGKHAVPGLPVQVLVQPALTLLVSVKPSKKKKKPR